MKRALSVGLLALAVLAAVLLGRTLAWRSVQKTAAVSPPYAVDAGAVAEHLAAAVRLATVSDPGKVDPETFTRLRALLKAQYPLTFQRLEVEEVGASLLLTWKGKEPALPPLLLLAHQDVVPVEPGSEASWTHPPWAGEIADGFVWGRGTLDDKACLVSLLEAVEALVGSGHVPRRTVLLAFGHDEEVGGTGAGAIAKLLGSRNVRPLLVLDEGMAVTRGLVPGIDRRVALVGIAEKGFLTLELSASTVGGHSSMPPLESAIGRVARAVSRLETTPTEASLDGTVGAFLDAVGPEMPFGLKLVMANRWLLSGVVLRIYDRKPSTRASARTTVAPTVFHAGVRDNVLAREAKATVNFRIRPGETTDSVKAWAARTIADPEVKLTESKESIRSDPSPVTKVTSPGYVRLERTLRGVFPDAVVAPGLVVGATDARHYAGLTDAALRFAPLLLGPDDLGRIHGVDERVGVANLGEMVRFYRQLVLDADAP